MKNICAYLLNRESGCASQRKFVFVLELMHSFRIDDRHYEHPSGYPYFRHNDYYIDVNGIPISGTDNRMHAIEIMQDTVEKCRTTEVAPVIARSYI